jgi:hypothetical protein
VCQPVIALTVSQGEKISIMLWLVQGTKGLLGVISSVSVSCQSKLQVEYGPTIQGGRIRSTTTASLESTIPQVGEKCKNWMLEYTPFD